MNFPSQATAIAVATLDASPPRQFDRHQSRKLIGVGLVSHHFDDVGLLKLRLRTNAIGLLSEDEALLDWLEDELTGCELLVADGLHDTLAMLRAELKVGRHLGLVELVDDPPARFHDLSESHWHGRRKSFVDMCRSSDVTVRPDSVVDIRACWATSLTRPIRDDLANRAAASWRVWASRQNGNDNPAVAEALNKLDGWLVECVAAPTDCARSAR